MPSFDDPLLGFEVRDSQLSNRLNTWRLLIESTSWNGLLSLYPKSYTDFSTTKMTTTATSELHSSTFPLLQQSKQKKLRFKGSGKHRNGTHRNRVKMDDPFQSKSHQLEESKTFFCGKLLEDYVHFVVERKDQENLLQEESLRNICYIDQAVLRMEQIPYDRADNMVNHTDTTITNNNTLTVSQSHFKYYCEVKNHDQCCPSWNLPNFILLYANKTGCDSFNETDINNFLNLLHSCAAFYADNYLNEDCATEPSQCPNVPERCYSHQNLVFNVFNYLVDYRFFGMNDQVNRNKTVENDNTTIRTDHPFLSATSIFLPMAKSSKLMSYYRRIPYSKLSLFNFSSFSTNHYDLTFGSIRVVAADLGLKHTLFSESLISDLILILIASLIIFGSLLLYTQSLLLTVTALLTNLASLASAYFIYTTIFGIEFFPFLNLLSVIILIGKKAHTHIQILEIMFFKLLGIGSDNALIYCKAWCCVASSTLHVTKYKSKKTNGFLRTEYHQQMKDALFHVLISTICASFTTCCAFFAGYFSEITSLKCFRYMIMII